MEDFNKLDEFLNELFYFTVSCKSIENDNTLEIDNETQILINQLVSDIKKCEKTNLLDLFYISMTTEMEKLCKIADKRQVISFYSRFIINLYKCTKKEVSKNANKL